MSDGADRLRWYFKLVVLAEAERLPDPDCLDLGRLKPKKEVGEMGKKGKGGKKKGC